MPCNQTCPNKALILADSGVFIIILGYLIKQASSFLDSSSIRQNINENFKKILKWIAECSENEKILIEESVYNEQLNLINSSSTISRMQRISEYYEHHELTQSISDILLSVLVRVQISDDELDEFSAQFQGERSINIRGVGRHDKKSMILACKQGRKTIFISQDAGLRTAVSELYFKTIVQIGGNDFNTHNITEKTLEQFLRQPYKLCKIDHAVYHEVFSGIIYEMANSLASGNQTSGKAILQKCLAFDRRSMQDAYEDKEMSTSGGRCWSGLSI